MTKPFDRKDYEMMLRGKPYIPVAGRLHWFRCEHPTWGIVTEATEINTEQAYAIFRTSIFDDAGKIIATATARETARGFADFIEKAETSSLGRALLFAGYGTDAAPELDEGERLADSPQPIHAPAPVPGPSEDEQALRDAGTRFVAVAQEHGFALTDANKRVDKVKVQQLMTDVYRFSSREKPAKLTATDYIFATRLLADYARDIDEAQSTEPPITLLDVPPTVAPTGNYTDAEGQNRGSAEPRGRTKAGAA